MDRKTLTLILASTLLATGCGSPLPSEQADADVSPQPDSGMLTIDLDTGMGLALVIRRGLPSSHDRNSYKFDIDSSEIKLTNLRLIADSVADGDERTTMQVLNGEWDQEKAAAFALYPDAPPGLYSRIRATIVEFELEGRVQLDDMAYHDLEISLESLSVPVDISINYDLEPTSPIAVKVEIDLRKVIDEVEFDELPRMGGDIKIEDDSSEEAIHKIKEKLEEAFDSPGPYIE